MLDEDVENLWQAITRIEAEQMLLQMKIADYSHMTKSAKETFHKKMWIKAYPDSQEAKPISFKELEVMLGGG